MQINPSGWYHNRIISALGNNVSFVRDNEIKQLCVCLTWLLNWWRQLGLSAGWSNVENGEYVVACATSHTGTMTLFE
jgi:hypothetical protein